MHASVPSHGHGWDICPHEVFRPSSVIEMKMSKDRSFDIFGRMSSLSNSCGEFLVFRVVDLGNEVIVWRSPDCWPVTPRASFLQWDVQSERKSGLGGDICVEVDWDCSLPHIGLRLGENEMEIVHTLRF